MDGFMHPMTNWPGFPFYGFGSIFVWIIFVVIAIFVYQDATQRGMNGALWFILIILPFIGIIFLLLYMVIRESQEYSKEEEGADALSVLKRRYAEGEINREDYLKMKEDLKK